MRTFGSFQVRSLFAASIVVHKGLLLLLLLRCQIAKDFLTLLRLTTSQFKLIDDLLVLQYLLLQTIQGLVVVFGDVLLTLRDAQIERLDMVYVLSGVC